jgi:hypothetical protein
MELYYNILQLFRDSVKNKVQINHDILSELEFDIEIEILLLLIEAEVQCGSEEEIVKYVFDNQKGNVINIITENQIRELINLIDDILYPEISTLSYFKNSLDEIRFGLIQESEILSRLDHYESLIEYNNQSDDNEIDDENEDLDSPLIQAKYYVHHVIKDLLKSTIKNFDQFNLLPEHVSALVRLYELVSNSRSYKFEGYVYIILKNYAENEEHDGWIANSITFDCDGLSIERTRHFYDEDGQSEFVTDHIYPVDSDPEALHIVSDIDDFIEEFNELLNIEDRKIECCDAIEDLKK